MPKPRPDSVVVHRFDLQPSLKDSLDNYLVGQTVTNGMSAIGGMIAPFSGAIAAIVAAWIAKEGIEGAIDKMGGYFEEKAEGIVEDRYGDELGKYKLVMSTLTACGSYEDLDAVSASLKTQLKAGPPPNIVYDAWKRFIVKGVQTGMWTDPNTQWGRPMAMKWKAFYPVDALIEDVKRDAKNWVGKKSRELLARVLFPISNLWL